MAFDKSRVAATIAAAILAQQKLAPSPETARDAAEFYKHVLYFLNLQFPDREQSTAAASAEVMSVPGAGFRAGGGPPDGIP